MNKADDIFDGTLNEIADAVHENAVKKGFHPEQPEADFINYQLMNSIVEIAELHDAWRRGNWKKPCDKAEEMKDLGLPVLSCAEEEYADLLIRTLDQCRRLKIDIARAVAIKHMFNTTRPFRHGNKLS
jgi:hypothetical protein